MVTVIKGNKREVPPDLPIGIWWERFQEYKSGNRVRDLPFYLPVMEYLSPEELATIRAKALVWYEVTGHWPKEIDCWWEVRQARKRGAVPPSSRCVVATVNPTGALVCGHCGARWSKNRDGGDWPDRCKLCDTRWMKCLPKSR